VSQKARRGLYIAIAILGVAWGVLLLASWVQSHRGSSSGRERATEDTSEITARDRARVSSAVEREPDAGVSYFEVTERERAPVRLSAPNVIRDAAAEHGAIEGRVVAFASNRGIAGAELSFEHGGSTHSVLTDARGAFTFAAPEEGPYVLALAMADGFLPFAPEWGHSPVRFEARSGVRLSGVVITLVDALEHTAIVTNEDGVLVEGAAIHVYGLERGERALAPLAADHRTDARGEARLIAPDGAVIEASHPEHGRGRASIDAGAQASLRVTITLSRTPEFTGDQRISGIVADARGRPIEGALITAHHEARRGSIESELHPLLEASSDGEGRFTLDGADSGSYSLSARADGYARAIVRSIAAGSDDVRLTLTPEALVRVRVRDGRGRAIAAVTVVVTRRVGAIQEENLAIVSSYDAEAEVLVGGLPPGPVRVSAVAPGYAPSPSHDAIAREDPEALELTLDRGGRIEGTVTDEEGPLEGARVTLESRIGDGSSAVPLEASALTDAQGAFALDGVPAGRRSFVVWAADHHGRLRDAVEVVAGETTDAGTIDLARVEEGETPRIEMAGIGAVLAAEGDALVIGRIVDGGGAAEVGLVAGDAILEIGGTSVVPLGFEGSIGRIRGPEGTTVTLRVRRLDGTIAVIAVPRRRIRA
jgi:hypothetical protein